MHRLIERLSIGGREMYIIIKNSFGCELDCISVVTREDLKEALIGLADCVDNGDVITFDGELIIRD